MSDTSIHQKINISLPASIMNEKYRFSKNKIHFHKKNTPQLLGHIGLQNMKVGEKTNFGRLATLFQICSMDADILS